VIFPIVATGILLVLAAVFISQCAFFNATKIVKPSPVDTSILKPLANYPDYDLDELKARIERLEGKEGVQSLSGDAWNTDQGGEWKFEFVYNHVDVYIWVYNRFENAASTPFLGGDNGVNPKKTEISDSVVAMLNPVVKYRSGDAPWFYEPLNNLFTSVRIGNIVVDINENSEDSNTIGTDTNKALAQIVSVLLPEAKTTPK